MRFGLHDAAAPARAVDFGFARARSRIRRSRGGDVAGLAAIRMAGERERHQRPDRVGTSQMASCKVDPSRPDDAIDVEYMMKHMFS